MIVPDITDKRTIPRVLIFTYLVFLCLHCIPVLTGSPKLWGVAQWYYFPRTTVLVLLALGLIPLFRFSRATFIALVSRIGSSRIVGRIRSHTSAGHLLFLSVAAVLFWVFRQSTHFLGDGYLWASRMETGTLFNPMRPLSSSLYQIAYAAISALGAPRHTSAYLAAAVISILSGLIFLVFAYKTVRTLTNQSAERIFLLLAILSSGTIALFFGYIEAYAPAAAGVMAFIYFGVRYIQGHERPHFIIVIFLLDVSLHLSLVALLPSLIVILAVREDVTRVRRRCYLLFSTVIVLGLAILWIAQRQKLLSGFFGNTFLPFVSASHAPRTAYAMISWKHLFDLLNEILLISPIAVLCVARFFRSPREEDTFDGRIVLFLESIALFYVAEYLVFNKVLGAGRDWDIFSSLGIALSLCAGIVLLERFRNIPRELTVFAFMLLALHNGPWIAVNASREKSLNRFVNLVDNGYWSGYARAYAYELLAKHSRNNNDNLQAMSYFLAALKADPKNVRYKQDLAEIFADTKQYPQALKYYEEILEQKPNSIETLNAIGILYGTIGQHDAAEKAFLDAVKINPAYIPAYENLARLYTQTNRIRQAIPVLEKCIELAPRTAALYRNVGMLYEKIGEPEKARSYLEKSEALEKARKK